MERDFLEDEPLSEDDRIKFIGLAIDNRQKLESIPNIEGFYDYLLRIHMNSECLKCVLCKVNQGKCYGKVGGNPCLVFRVRG